MILGERIKRIRTFRGLTQRELGLKLGYEERNADVRVAQYESGYRVPKKDTLMEIARILNPPGIWPDDKPLQIPSLSLC